MELDTLGFACTTGYLHDGQPQGKTSSINGVNTYYAMPPNGSTDKAVLIFTDAMGHGFINNQLIADDFAANGYFTVMPDLFRGDPIPIHRPRGFDPLQWLRNHPQDKVRASIDTVLRDMMVRAKCKKIVGVGYCIGAKYVIRYLRHGILSAGFIAHPNAIDPEEFLAIKAPLSVAAAAEDDTFTSQKRHEMEGFLKRGDMPYQVNLHSGVGHGFAVRCDMSDPNAKFAKEQAFAQAVQWFDHHIPS